MRPFFCLLTVGLGFVACQPSEPVSPDTLTGTWVESSARRDTLIFNPDQAGTSLPGMLIVNRGKEINVGGYLLPKIGSGIYSYTVQGKRIYVQNMLSSYSQGAEYTIERKGENLYVDNFFELAPRESATATRTLVRLR